MIASFKSSPHFLYHNVFPSDKYDTTRNHTVKQSCPDHTTDKGQETHFTILFIRTCCRTLVLLLQVWFVIRGSLHRSDSTDFSTTHDQASYNGHRVQESYLALLSHLDSQQKGKNANNEEFSKG